MSNYKEYTPLSHMHQLDTLVPENLHTASLEALSQLKSDVGDVDDYVAYHLEFEVEDLGKMLAAEQVDGVAMAIRNILHGKALIIGDQTGLGKGRQAAAIIRYGIKRGLFPVFFTAKRNLFSDLYRDMKALRSEHYKPLILNGGGKMVDYDNRTSFEHDDSDADEPLLRDYEVVYKNDRAITNTINTHGADKRIATQLMKDYDYMVSTYSQLNQADCLPRQAMLQHIAATKRLLLVLDESHEAAGNGNTSRNILQLIRASRGCIYLTATFAKRVDNLVIYGPKTIIQQQVSDDKSLIQALKRGGLPMQELLSAQLVRVGQMIRREKDFKGVEVVYETYHNTEAFHRRMYDICMEYVAAIHCFRQNNEEVIKAIRSNAVKRFKADGAIFHSDPSDERHIKEINAARLPDVFSFISQLSEAITFALKAENIAETCLREVKAGRSVVVAISKTSERAIKCLTPNDGGHLKPGVVVRATINNLLISALQRTMKVENMTDFTLPYFLPDLDENHCIPQSAAYFTLLGLIKKAELPLPISPIDAIVERLSKQGVRVTECTARQSRLSYLENGRDAIYLLREKPNTDWIYNEFQNNHIDVMLINSTGALGASAHAVPTTLVPKEKVRRRVMIIAQPELNVSMEIQKRGRINRLGQLASLPPKFIYATSAIPHEQRTLMMLKRKLKSLDANTSAFQEQNRQMLDCVDFYNKYGDEVVADWLNSNHDIELESLGSPRLNMSNDNGLALKVSARIAAMSCEMQEKFYTQVIENYEAKLKLLNEEGRNDLETTVKDWHAHEQMRDLFLPMSIDDDSANTYIGRYECQVERWPLSFDEVERDIQRYYPNFRASEPFINPSLSGTISEMTDFYIERLKQTCQLHDNYSLADEVRVDKVELDQDHVRKVVYFFRPGRYVIIPLNDDNLVDAVVSHISFGNNSAKKYLPSQVRVHFILAHNSRRIEYNCYDGRLNGDSGYNQLEKIMQLSNDVASCFDFRLETMRERWNKECRHYQRQTAEQYLLTGNLLAAYTSKWADRLGRLVAFTDSNDTKQWGIIVDRGLAHDFSKLTEICLPPAHSISYRLILLLQRGQKVELRGLNGRAEITPADDNIDSIEVRVPWWHRPLMEYLLHHCQIPPTLVSEHQGHFVVAISQKQLPEALNYFTQKGCELYVSKDFVKESLDAICCNDK